VTDCGEGCLKYCGGHGVEALARGWESGAESVNDRFGAADSGNDSQLSC
jgi:hypothetical protein